MRASRLAISSSLGREMGIDQSWLRHYLVAVASLNESDGGAGTVLPVRGVGAFGGEAGVAIEAYPGAFFEEFDEVGDVGGVVAVADVDAVEVDTLLFEDYGLLKADPSRGPRCGLKWGPRWPCGLGRRRGG